MEQLKRWYWKKAFGRDLGLLLYKRFGRRKLYKPSQVQTIVEHLRWPSDYIYLGYAMYCNRNDFESTQPNDGSAKDYDSVRKEGSPSLFEKNPSFTATDLIVTTGGIAALDSLSDPHDSDSFHGCDGAGDSGS